MVIGTVSLSTQNGAWIKRKPTRNGKCLRFREYKNEKSSLLAANCR